MQIRPARPGEAPALSDLAMRSKAHWGYDEGFLADCRDELTLHPAEVERRRTQVAVADAGTGAEPGATAADGSRTGRLLGFTTLEGIPTLAVLGMMFVAPEAIGQGVGGRLFRHTMDLARSLRFTRVRIDSDPHAEPFYRAMGAVRIGDTPSGSVPGRVLPLLEVDLTADRGRERGRAGAGR